MSDQRTDVDQDEKEPTEGQDDASKSRAATAPRRDETRSGQEATNDAPRDHTHEHQSNYGGGGENGGASNG